MFGKISTFWENFRPFLCTQVPTCPHPCLLTSTAQQTTKMVGESGMFSQSEYLLKSTLTDHLLWKSRRGARSPSADAHASISYFYNFSSFRSTSATLNLSEIEKNVSFLAHLFVRFSWTQKQRRKLCLLVKLRSAARITTGWDIHPCLVQRHEKRTCQLGLQTIPLMLNIKQGKLWVPTFWVFWFDSTRNSSPTWRILLPLYRLGTYLFVKVPRPGDSEVTFSVFESSYHLLIPV